VCEDSKLFVAEEALVIMIVPCSKFDYKMMLTV